ncbi:beta strand repeat-containing protein [Clostridium beijerinckii]|uniref:beta strand repeat-containing protein n=1 Tax=Clostridium beijerinckii TaxID=1520 RepID=UPI001570D54C|nr:hypothetical protein [Clostridium beijerinckii]NRU52593.1 hypothetical protein [Clostridium beijerinckii]NYC68636.1 hypothetical protein [Clostridium beijerinckii]
MVSMDGLMAWVLANGYTDEVGSGISGLNPTPTGFELITTSGTTLPFTIPNLHTHSNLNNILEKLSLDVNNKLLFDGQPIGNGGDFSNYALKNGDVNNDFLANNVTVKGNIMPSANGTQSIGSPTNRFKEIYVNEAKLSVNTLYLGDTPVMGTNQDTIVIKGDKDQSIAVKTTGIGTTNLISEGNVTLSTSGMNANVNVQATGQGANANLSATNQVNLNAPNINIQGTSTEVKGAMAVDSLTIRGDVTINGGATTIQSTIVPVEDNIIELNKGEVGYGVTAGRAGLKIDRGDADDYLIIFDETDNDSLKIGTDSVLKKVATENYVDNKIPTITSKADKVLNSVSGDIATLDTNGNLVDSGKKISDLVLNTTTINGKTLNSNITLNKSDIGLGNVPNIDTTNASSITNGTLPPAQLPVATSTTIGGVKAGTNITISADGTISSTANGSNNINDNLTTSTSNTYSIDKIVSLLANKQNKIIVSTTKPTDLTINNFWLDISSNTSYKLLRSNGTDYIQIGSSSGTDNQFEVVSTLPTENINTNKMYLLSSDNSINVYNGTTWNNYGGTNAGGGLTPEQETQISNIQYKQNISDNNLTTPIKQITPAINYLNSSLETAKTDINSKASADNVVNNSTFNSHVDSRNPHQTKISNLADVQVSTLLDGQSIIYDATNSIFKNATISGTTDEKVKLTASSTSSDYLSNLIDNTTIQIANNKIVAKTLDGLNVTLSELNNISGLNENIMTKFSNFANGGVQVYNGVFSSYANLLAFNFSTLTSGKTYLMYVSSDENHSNNGTTYMCNNTTNNSTQLPYYCGLSSATQRDLTVNKVSLTTEVKNILPQANMDLTGIAKTTDLNAYMKTSDYTGTGTTSVNVAKALQGMASTISQVDNSVNLSHSHPNKSYIDKLGEDANGKPTYNGSPIGSSTINSDTMLMSVYDPNKDGSVSMSDKLSSELTASNGTVYYKNNSGVVGWFQPPITPPETSSIRQLEFQNLTTNIPQIQDFYPALTDIKGITQIYEFIGGTSLTGLVADFTNILTINKTDNTITTSNGLKIQDNFNYTLTITDNTTYVVKESQMIDVNQYINISSISNS